MSKFADFFNADDYERGMREGRADGLAGKDRNFSRMGTTVKFVFGGSTTLDSYTRGYKAGYLLGVADRLRAQQGIEREEVSAAPTPQQITNKININNLTIDTMGYRGIQGQIDLLEQMKAFLQSIKEQLDDSIEMQTNFLGNLDSEGLDLDILNNLEDYLASKTEHLKGLVSIIEDEEIPYVEQVIEYLEDHP